MDLEWGESTAYIFLHPAPFGWIEFMQKLSLNWHIHFKQELY